MANEIVTEIRLELDKLRSDLKDAEKASKDTGEKAGKDVGQGIEDGLGKAFGGMKTAFAALAGVIGAAFTLKESIHAAVEQENAINSLNSAMALSGTYTAAASQHFQDYTASLQKTTVYADEVIQQGGSLLVALGHLSGQGLDRATAASLDMAAALGMDATSAFNLVAKAATGHTAALGRYGITVKQTGDETRDFNNALIALETKFKGFAALQAGTFDGAMKQMNNQFGEILESLGNIIIKSPTVIAVMNYLAKTFAQVADAITKWAAGRDIISELADVLIDVGHTITTYVIAPIELLYNLLVTDFNILKTVIQGIVVGIATAAGAITGMLAAISPDKFGAMNDAVKSFAADSGTTLAGFASDTSKAFDNMFDFNASATADKYLGQVQEFVDTVTPPIVADFKKISDAVQADSTSFLGKFVEGFKDAANKVAGSTQAMGNSLKALGTQVFATIGTGMTNAFVAMGAAMQKGENGLAAFGKAMLGTLGDIAIQIGAMFIAWGVANVASLNPIGAAQIIAGGALAALGGALKAYAGGGGASAPAGGGSSSAGGGVAAGGGAGVAPPQDVGQGFTDSQRGEVGSKVEVHVQGNVFDRRETGLMIADTINEAFGSNGVTFATGAS